MTLRIVDTFPFSEPYEVELLLMKLELEAPIVEQWVIVENTYTFRGEYKGLFAAEMIRSDERFAGYRDRIEIISANRPVRSIADPADAQLAAFEVEYWQRDLALEALRDSPSGTWIFISDVDEMLDATDDRRIAELERRSADSDGVLRISCQRYWFDFDNAYPIQFGCPFASTDVVFDRELKLSDLRRQLSGELAPSWDLPVVFEYSSCFPADQIRRKLTTQSHSGYLSADLERAFRLNCRPLPSLNSPKQRRLELTEEDLLETVPLNVDNSPRLIRERLHEIRTGNIDPSYAANRRREDSSLNRLRVRLYRARRAFYEKYVYFIRRLGVKSYRLQPPPVAPSPWLKHGADTSELEKAKDVG